MVFLARLPLSDPVGNFNPSGMGYPFCCRKLTLKEYSDKFLTAGEKWFQIIVDMIEKVVKQCSTLDDFVVVSCKLPNIFTKVTCKDNLELSIIWNTAFDAGFLEIILSFYNY